MESPPWLRSSRRDNLLPRLAAWSMGPCATTGNRLPSAGIAAYCWRVDHAPTIYDVARAAGVAPSTVSRAFSRPGRVNAQTAARIRQVANDLGYRTNPLARGLSTARTQMIALMVPDITNPFYFEIIRGAESAAAEAGYTLVLSDTQESRRLEQVALERAAPAVEGLVLLSTRMSDAEIRQYAGQKPLLVLNRAVSDVPSVITDNAQGTRRAAEHLGRLGHATITYVAGPEASWADASRWLALREASIELELKVHRIGPFIPTIEGGLYAAQEFVASPTSAAICYNDILAVGFLRGLAAEGLRVPDDVSVIGFDNTLIADLVEPGLTTVAAPLRTMGTTGVQNLLAHINGARSRTGEPVILPTRLVVRGSTMPVGQRR